MKIISTKTSQPEEIVTQCKNSLLQYTPIQNYKFSIQLKDNNIIETGVFILKNYHNNLERHICISTQAGCRFKCKMCSSGQNKFTRNLDSSEILEQIKLTSEYLKISEFEKLIFMRIGEAFDNYKNLIQTLKILKQTKSNSKIGIATIGIPNKLKHFSSMITKNIIPTPEMVWISLHAATTEKRKKLMPIASKYKIDDIIQVTKNFAIKHPQTKIWINYMLFDKFNDNFSDAKKLTQILQDTQNIFSLMLTIPNNDFLRYRRTTSQGVDRFYSYLRELSMQNQITKFVAAGHEINAGCGEFIFTPNT